MHQKVLAWDKTARFQRRCLVFEIEAFSPKVRAMEMALRWCSEAEKQAVAQAPLDHRSVLVVAMSAGFYRDRQRLADFAVRQKIASVFAVREWVDAGGLSQTRAMRQSDSPVAGNLAPFAKCHEWLAPEVLEARRRQLGVPHRVLDILVPEVIL